METEFEATFLEINKDILREKLREQGGNLVREEYLQKRYNFDLQNLGKNFWEWVRIRDEGNKVTIAYKKIPPEASIKEQKEIEFEISDMTKAVSFMEVLGGKITNYSETLRERWVLDSATIDIDTWPHLKPYVEIEGESEDKVRIVSERLGFEWGQAKFCGAGTIYEMEYGVHPDKVSKDSMIRLTFDDPNPLLS